MASSESGRFLWQPLWFYTKGFSDEAVNASISVLKYSFFPFVVDTNYTSPLEFKDPPSLLLHRLKPSTTTLFLFILDLYLQQPVCSFVSAWLHCFFCAVAPLSRTLRTTPPPRSEMSHVIVEQLTSFTTDGGPTSPAWTVLWTPQRTASCQQNQSRKTSAYKQRGRTSGFHSCDAVASTWGAFYHLDGVSVTLALFRGKQLKNEMDIPATRVLFKTCHWFDHVFWILTLDKPTVSCLICTRLSRGQVVMKITLNISVDSALWVLLLVNNWSIFPFLPSISTLLDGVSTPWIVRISFQACVSLFHN